ncbi:hypothetical protein [Acidithiobacillus ferrianus]|uniref:hypothetical protein n=1 Tax=Acidithiobacillus ferrianus TaxID=2678518 RepID=UPI0034E540FD
MDFPRRLRDGHYPKFVCRPAYPLRCYAIYIIVARGIQCGRDFLSDGCSRRISASFVDGDDAPGVGDIEDGGLRQVATPVELRHFSQKGKRVAIFEKVRMPSTVVKKSDGEQLAPAGSRIGVVRGHLEKFTIPVRGNDFSDDQALFSQVGVGYGDGKPPILVA